MCIRHKIPFMQCAQLLSILPPVYSFLCIYALLIFRVVMTTSMHGSAVSLVLMTKQLQMQHISYPYQNNVCILEMYVYMSDLEASLNPESFSEYCTRLSYIVTAGWMWSAKFKVRFTKCVSLIIASISSRSWLSNKKSCGCLQGEEDL